MLGELKLGNIGSKTDISDGYIFTLNNKLVYTDGDYENYKITKVFEINVKEKSEIEDTRTSFLQEVISDHDKQRNASIRDEEDYTWYSLFSLCSFGQEAVITGELINYSRKDNETSYFKGVGRSSNTANQNIRNKQVGGRNNKQLSELLRR